VTESNCFGSAENTNCSALRTSISFALAASNCSSRFFKPSAAPQNFGVARPSPVPAGSSIESGRSKRTLPISSWRHSLPSKGKGGLTAACSR
jgi:hypothetical protein